MKNKFDKIRELLNEINNLFEEVEKHKQVYDLDKLNKLNEMLKIFKNRKRTIINDTFDVRGIDENEAINKLESLKKLTSIILELEKNIKEDKKMKKSQLKALIKEQVTSILKEDSYKQLLLDKIKNSKLSEEEKKKYLDKCSASDFNSNDIPKLITQIEQEESKKN